MSTPLNYALTKFPIFKYLPVLILFFWHIQLDIMLLITAFSPDMLTVLRNTYIHRGHI
jgi:hypothetical protein